MDYISRHNYKSWENCEYCQQSFDVIDLHELMLRGHKCRIVLRCEACRLDMKQYVIHK
jgi:hypothetical protein